MVNATGLSGKYDFSLDFSPYLPEAGKKCVRAEYVRAVACIEANNWPVE